MPDDQSENIAMLCAEGDTWRRHRRLINPTLDHRAVVADAPMLAEIAEEMAGHLARVPAGEAIDIGQAFAHLITLSTRHAFTADDSDIEPMLDRLLKIPNAHDRSAGGNHSETAFAAPG